MVRIPQKLVAFWSWNLDFMVFQPWNPDVLRHRVSAEF